MDHIVYLDAKSRELENLLCGKKSMIVRGATDRKVPYGKVFTGDVLYFINNNGEGKIKARGDVSLVFNSKKMTTEESVALIQEYQDKLKLTETQFRKWAGKRYVVLIEIENIEEVQPFRFNREIYQNMMDDWLLIGDIEAAKQVNYILSETDNFPIFKR